MAPRGSAMACPRSVRARGGRTIRRCRSARAALLHVANAERTPWQRRADRAHRVATVTPRTCHGERRRRRPRGHRPLTTTAMLSPSRNQPNCGPQTRAALPRNGQVDEHRRRAPQPCCRPIMAIAPPMIDAAAASPETLSDDPDHLDRPTRQASRSTPRRLVASKKSAAKTPRSIATSTNTPSGHDAGPHQGDPRAARLPREERGDRAALPRGADRRRADHEADQDRDERQIRRISGSSDNAVAAGRETKDRPLPQNARQSSTLRPCFGAFRPTGHRPARSSRLALRLHRAITTATRCRRAQRGEHLHEPARPHAGATPTRRARITAPAPWSSRVSSRNTVSRSTSSGRSSVTKRPRSARVRRDALRFVPAAASTRSASPASVDRRCPASSSAPPPGSQVAELDEQSHGAARARAPRPPGPAVTSRPSRDDRDAVARLLDLGQDVARHEHGAPLGAERSEQLAHLDDAGGVEPVRGLVEDRAARGPCSSAAAMPSRCFMPSE